MTPGPLVSPSRIVAVSSGELHHLALREDGKVWAWGKASVLGLPGDDVTSPVLLEGVDKIDAIYAGKFYSLFLQDGLLLQHSYDNGAILLIDEIDGVVKALGRRKNILALREDGTVWIVGDGAQGQLGNGQFEPTDHFIQVDIEGVIDVAMYDGDVATVREDGTMWIWGVNRVTQREERIIATPELVSQVTDVKRVAFGYGVLAAHGNGTVSVLGVDTVIPMSGLTEIVEVAGHAGYGKDYGLASDGTLWAWGATWHGLGIGPTPEPPQFDAFSAKRVIVPNVAAFSLNLALDNDGVVWGWGTASKSGNTPAPIILSG
jgi:alpha-tubulin suppressor-like RCC1 family protein